MQRDVIVVGAGAAGIGVGIVLKTLGIENFLIIERERIGASFANWPEEMRFITPSFPSSGFGLLDLNAISIQTSPGWSLSREHFSGRDYAMYLEALASHYELPINVGVDVRDVTTSYCGDGFELNTTDGPLLARCIVWAAGEFQYPNDRPFPGAEYGVHNSTVGSWADLDGDEFVVVGGYESGIDAAVHLSKLERKVAVLDSLEPWQSDSANPSIALSPYTSQRLRLEYQYGNIELVSDVLVQEIRRERQGYRVRARDGREWTTSAKPILATGFIGGLHPIKNLFEWSDAGHALLTENDESTLIPGLFVSGPGVRHGPLNFCFIYKFRQRFAVIARAIGQTLGVDTEILEELRQHQMFLDDLSCCDESCVC